jgi:hypothetical protein
LDVASVSGHVENRDESTCVSLGRVSKPLARKADNEKITRKLPILKREYSASLKARQSIHELDELRGTLALRKAREMESVTS